MMNDTEEIRQSFKPDNIRILLIGESAPASGQFFYKHSRMTRYVAQAFTHVFNKPFDDDSTFLKFFQEKGCYLDDLALSPVNHMTAKQRNKTLEDSIVHLSQRITDHNPDVIVIVLKRIAKYVIKAIELSKKSCPVYTLPFPGYGRQNKFISEFSGILKAYLKGET
ncbi:MAG: hypothetical protein ACPLYF_03525 [Fervidobacterium sp.]